MKAFLELPIIIWYVIYLVLPFQDLISGQLNSSVTRLFVQQLNQAKFTYESPLLSLGANPPISDGSMHKGQLMRRMFPGHDIVIIIANEEDPNLRRQWRRSKCHFSDWRLKDRQTFRLTNWIGCYRIMLARELVTMTNNFRLNPRDNFEIKVFQL